MTIGSPKHLEARRYAEDGIPVFPCRVDGKEPACEHGLNDATTDLEQIDAWWSQEDFNIGVEPERAGWAVVDVDPGGLEAWDHLCEEHSDWRSTRVRTPRGGLHIYYVGSLPPTVGTEKNGIAAGIDTRGRGSYVLVPPSSVHGRIYSWEGEDDTAELPAWIADACKRKSVEVAASVLELDLPANLARADAFLKTLAPVNEGQRNATAFVTACKLRDLGLSPDATYERMVAWNDTHCNPPIEETELALTVGSACKNAQNAAGAFGVTSAAEAFGATLSKYAEASPRSSRPRFYVYSEDEQDEMQEPSWLVPDLLPDASTVMWYGETGSYKSFLALDVALGLAFGKPTFGFTPPAPVEVVYIAGEGPRSISRRRRPAWKIAREATGRGLFGLITNMPLARGDGSMVIEAIEQIKAQGLKPKLIVIDTAANAMAGMNENDAKDATTFIEALEALKRAFGATVLVVHHSGKDTDRGARGSSALKAGVDAAFRIAATHATRAVAVTCEKMKDAEERADPWTFEGKQVGPSLVFFPTTAGEHAKLTASQNEFERRKVGAALMALGAIGREKAVTTQVLATHLFPGDAAMSETDKANTLQRACKTLNALARNKLTAYCTIEGAQRWWHLPAEVGGEE